MKKTILYRPNSVIEDRWLGLGDLHNREIFNPLIGRCKEDIENPGLLETAYMRNPSYLAFAAKVLLDIDLLPIQAAILEELWIRPFPMYIASRGFGKSFLSAVFATLKCALVPNTKVVVVGAAFRQSKVIFEYMDTIWKNASVLRSICSNDSGPRGSVDRCVMIINDSTATFIPLGDGSKIRGLRATVIMADEFASIPTDIYETVVSGFAAVSAKPIDNVKAYFEREARKELGQWSPEEEQEFMGRSSNQAIISGTADYDFMPYADYWKKYWVYINSDNDPNKPVVLPGGETKYLKDYFQDGKIPDSFRSEDYSILRIPYSIIPKGFMDDKVVARAKASVHKASYLKEYGACFPKDSDGFFKRSTIEACVASEKNINQPNWPAWCPEPFDPILRGSPNKRYVIGVDPAASRDNFSIVVLELWAEHTRVVYAWSTNLEDYKRRKKAGLIKDSEYYSFCARKIRNLAKVFPTDDIAIDSQGGGLAIMEALQDPSKLEEGEVPFYPTNRILKPEKELDSDLLPGKHNLHMCQFANYDFTSNANYNTSKDLSDKVLLFPRFDTLTLEISAHKDAEMADKLGLKNIFDTLEDAVMEIESLKDELCSIVMTRTGTGVNSRDRWDTPETLTPEGKKARMRKDRYSAFIMANYISRSIQRAPAPVEYNVIGGFSHQLKSKRDDKRVSGTRKMGLYQGPDWFTSEVNNRNVIRSVKKKSV